MDNMKLVEFLMDTVERLLIIAKEQNRRLTLYEQDEAIADQIVALSGQYDRELYPEGRKE